MELYGDNVVLFQAILDYIRKEMNRLYWNKYQQEMESPFDNTGAAYENDTFSVMAYYWGDDDELIDKPNFKYKDIEISWYKHSNRGMVVKAPHPITYEDLVIMVNDCIDSLRRDFNDSNDNRG